MDQMSVMNPLQKSDGIFCSSAFKLMSKQVLHLLKLQLNKINFLCIYNLIYRLWWSFFGLEEIKVKVNDEESSAICYYLIKNNGNLITIILHEVRLIARCKILLELNEKF